MLGRLLKRLLGCGYLSSLFSSLLPSHSPSHSHSHALTLIVPSIYLVHDDAKDKEFELELSWIGPETGYEHHVVPRELVDEVEGFARAAVEIE